MAPSPESADKLLLNLGLSPFPGDTLLVSCPALLTLLTGSCYPASTSPRPPPWCSQTVLPALGFQWGAHRSFHLSGDRATGASVVTFPGPPRSPELSCSASCHLWGAPFPGGHFLTYAEIISRQEASKMSQWGKTVIHSLINFYFIFL